MILLKKIFLAPFWALYAAAIALRNLAYDKKWFRASKFDIPVICIGNLSTGGTGKTPHTDYLIDLLKNERTVGVLSRGYGRKTAGFKEVLQNSTSDEVGDEPLLFKLKHTEVKVCVSEDRALGIPAMATNEMVILLDDAFQHRAVKAGISILLTDYQQLYTDDELLPVGNLREFPSGANRADLIVVTKCPLMISSEEKEKIKAKIAPKSYQYVFFSHIRYHKEYRLFAPNEILDNKAGTEVLLLSGIANPQGIKSYLEKQYKNVYLRKFADHHNYTRKDIESIFESYKNLGSGRKIIITTEKDATRLLPYRDFFIKNEILIYSLPIKINFAADKQRFEQAIHLYVNTTLKNETEEHEHH